ncbi:MAG: DNA alkylation repair protein [Flavobacteriales bacterium]|jgi:3-methyladenine DNA glycosylase AlkC|nr:DNA alkylation repair protein [Flavobacteriales bacterium]
MSETLLLKNIFSPILVSILAQNVKIVHPEFREKDFINRIEPNLDSLELKQRAQLISLALHEFLPQNYVDACRIIKASMSLSDSDRQKIGKYPEFYFMPFAEYIAAYGLEYFDDSTSAMYDLTKVFTSEFCIRPFIEKYPLEMNRMLHQWAMDESQHVRRLVSEGTRPRLPWASRLPAFQKDPKPVFELLEKLKSDPELYVRRSVANNLNDIAKDNPDQVMKCLQRWSSVNDVGTQWVIGHASRTLIKDGHIEALKLQGFDPAAPLKVEAFKVDGLVNYGGKLTFEFKLTNTGTSASNYLIDFVIHFMKSNGRQAPKVFKLSAKKLRPGDSVHVVKAHPIKPISTRKYYNGPQRIAIQINGVERAEALFQLEGVS